MIKIDYTMKAKVNLHSGSDSNLGTTKNLRRQKIMLQNQIIIKAGFEEKERMNVIVNILLAIHKSIDWDKIKGKRLMKIWDEWHSKLLKSASTPDKYFFFSMLCNIWDVRSVKEEYIENVTEILDQITSEELLETVRSKSHYIILKLRTKSKEKLFVKSKINSDKKINEKFIKTFEMIPCISGNSIRGSMRRIAMYDFVKRVGIKKLDKDTYHMLFTGGVLNQSSMYEDLDKREKLITYCPLIGVFGSAIGNMTIEGQMAVSFAYPKCVELGTGSKSFWENLDVVFGTRLDSSKSENQIEVSGDHDAPDQMKYEYEVFSPNTEFKQSFRMRTIDELNVSAFWHMIKLWKENPQVGGMWSTGAADVDLSEIKVPENAEKLYTDYLNDNKDEIRKFLNYDK